MASYFFYSKKEVIKNYINLLIQTIVTELHFFLFVENNNIYTLLMHFTKYLLTIIGLYINLLLEVPTISVYVINLTS